MLKNVITGWLENVIQFSNPTLSKWGSLEIDAEKDLVCRIFFKTQYLMKEKEKNKDCPRNKKDKTFRNY